MTEKGFYTPEVLKSIVDFSERKVSSFFMDFFGYRESRIFLEDNYCIHIYYNGKINMIDFYKGNDLICQSEVITHSTHEWIHLCKDKITSRFYIRCDDGKRLRGIPFKAVFPHIKGMRINIKKTCLEAI